MEKRTGCKYIDVYLDAIRTEARPASKEMRQAAEYIAGKLTAPGVVIDAEKTERARELIEKYFGMVLMDWELFVLALVHCYYPDDTLVFTEFLIMMGRGNGKNGFISGLAWYLTTPDHGVQGYNVDIIANSEDQAKTSFEDVYEMLERNWGKLKRFFYKSRELIKSLRTGSYIKFNTSNARTKDGKRSACLIFDEEHEYENDDSIRVFKSGFGKRRHSRVFKITTNGYVRDGVLDKDLEIAHAVLNGEIPDSRLCPLLYKADGEEDVRDKTAWVKACPSLPYLENLRIQMEQEFTSLAYDKSTELDFYTKRMNLPRSNMEIAVTEWANIAATNTPLPDLRGLTCTVGIDYASLRDWAAVDFHFQRGSERFDFGHYWLCLRNPDLSRVKAPWRAWADLGLVTPVDDVEIAPELLTEYIARTAQDYYVKTVALDNFRYALMRDALLKIGFGAKEFGNVYLTRPSDIMKVQPIIDSCFNNHWFTWGDNPPLRWAVNNTKLVRSGRREGTDTGNFYYAKIEAKSRKTDPFMALAAAMCVEEDNGTGPSGDLPELGVIIG
ncbi:terminase large subunit [Oscillospiraceae bacterium]|nr:terminase large subunit [Oscillospiraceae bacterium]